MDINVKGIKYIKTKNGGYFKEYTRTDTIPDEKVRDNVMCTRCGFSTYPACKSDCPVRRKRNGK